MKPLLVLDWDMVKNSWQKTTISISIPASRKEALGDDVQVLLIEIQISLPDRWGMLNRENVGLIMNLVLFLDEKLKIRPGGR